MKLFERKKEVIDVYDLEPNEEKIIKYRMDKMAEIPEGERVFIAEATIDKKKHYPTKMDAVTYTYDKPLFEKYAGRFDEEIIPNEEVFSNGHYLIGDVNSRNKTKALLDNYYYGAFDRYNVARVQDKEKIRYFLLRNTMYLQKVHLNMVAMNDIIELPKALYLLQMFRQEKYSLLENENLTDIFNMYTLTYNGAVTYEELDRFDRLGITNQAYNNALVKAENDEKLLKLKRTPRR